MNLWDSEERGLKEAINTKRLQRKHPVGAFFLLPDSENQEIIRK